MTLISAHSPVWLDQEHTSLDIHCTFLELPNEEIVFLACPTDVEPHGREIFARAVAGEFGSIKEYVPPPLPSVEEVAADIRKERNRLLQATDWSQAADVPQQTKDIWAPYRQELRDLPGDPNFPWYDSFVTDGLNAVPWPHKP